MKDGLPVHVGRRVVPKVLLVVLAVVLRGRSGERCLPDWRLALLVEPRRRHPGEGVYLELGEVLQGVRAPGVVLVWAQFHAGLRRGGGGRGGRVARPGGSAVLGLAAAALALQVAEFAPGRKKMPNDGSATVSRLSQVGITNPNKRHDFFLVFLWGEGSN